jgi:hypothetical protein
MMPKTQLTWYGQSGFKMVTPGGDVLLIDPWLTNPVFEKGKEELAALKDADFILVTHGHSDHVGNAVEIGKKTGAKLVATFDLSAAMVTALGYPSELANTETTGHFGGTLNLLAGEVSVTFVLAWHGSTVQKDEISPAVPAGMPTGLVICAADAVKLVGPRNGNSDALRHVSCVDRNAGRVCRGIKKAQRKNRATRNERGRDDHSLNKERRNRCGKEDLKQSQPKPSKKKAKWEFWEMGLHWLRISFQPA